jgi:hypothetical protein
MNATELIDDMVSTENELLQLQLQIARRADELAQTRAHRQSGQTDRDFWLEAENEVLNPGAEPALARSPLCGDPCAPRTRTRICLARCSEHWPEPQLANGCELV